MKRNAKIIEAQALVKGHIKTIESKLSKLLTAKDLKKIQPDLENIKTAGKFLNVRLLELDEKFKAKLAKLSEDEE